jgi:hypothetical protein
LLVGWLVASSKQQLTESLLEIHLSMMDQPTIVSFQRLCGSPVFSTTCTQLSPPDGSTPRYCLSSCCSIVVTFPLSLFVDDNSASDDYDDDDDLSIHGAAAAATEAAAAAAAAAAIAEAAEMELRGWRACASR